MILSSQRPKPKDRLKPVPTGQEAGSTSCGPGGIPNSTKHRRQDRQRYQLVLTKLDYVQASGTGQEADPTGGRVCTL
jgi:hypothetical protein